LTLLDVEPFGVLSVLHCVAPRRHAWRIRFDDTMAFSSFVWGVAVLLALGVGALQWYMRKTQHQRAKPTDAEAHLPGFTHEFSSFQQTYLIVYYLVMCTFGFFCFFGSFFSFELSPE
jgi:hypothetical protein